MRTFELYDNDVVLEFDPSKHVYTYDGVVIPSVTTITGMIDKPALVQWAVNATIESVQSELLPDAGYEGSFIIGLLGNSKYARYKQSKKALDIGANVHNWIERYIKSSIHKTKMPKMPKTDEELACIDSFLMWEKMHDIEWLMTEKVVFSRIYEYAGTMDILAFVDGNLVVIDAKTSKAVYDDYILQVSAYAKAFSEEYRRQVDKIAILRVPKDAGEKVEYVERDDIDEVFRGFLGALLVWKAKDRLEKERL